MIVGDHYEDSASGPYRGFVYKSGKCSTIDYPGASSTSAKSINKSGQISGWYTGLRGVFHGFVKTGANFQKIDYPGASGTLVFHMNDKGQVAGWYEDTSGAYHGFVATPKPSISSFRPPAGR